MNMLPYLKVVCDAIISLFVTMSTVRIKPSIGRAFAHENSIHLLIRCIGVACHRSYNTTC